MERVEEIRAKVKMRKDELHYLPFTDENLGKINAYEFVLKIIDSLPEEPISEDLDEAAEKHALQCHSKKASVATLAASKYDFIAGANWKEQQMMKNSEPAEVGYWNQRGLSIHFDKSLERLGLKEDDKVKVLIIKND